MKNNQLPNKLSECIKVALHDLELCKNDDRYIIDFQKWHDIINTSPGQFNTNTFKCSVCFAGSVMAKTLQADIKTRCIPSDFSYEDHVRLSALDDIRQGYVKSALRIMDINFFDHNYTNIKNISVNECNYDEFVRDMNKIITMLEEYNL
jgi:hypothetical protein